jgi:hypothetical protein
MIKREGGDGVDCQMHVDHPNWISCSVCGKYMDPEEFVNLDDAFCKMCCTEPKDITESRCSVCCE